MTEAGGTGRTLNAIYLCRTCKELVQAEEDNLDCPECDKPMSNIGWVECVEKK